MPTFGDVVVKTLRDYGLDDDEIKSAIDDGRRTNSNWHLVDPLWDKPASQFTYGLISLFALSLVPL